VRQHGRRVHIGLAAEELVAHLGPAVVDAAGLGLGLLDELGHDGRGRLPVGDGEGRLDGAERLRGAHRAHLLAHAGEARVDLPVGGAEAVHARLALVELVLGAVELDLVEGGGAVEDLADARADIVQVRQHGRRVHIGLAAEELVAHLGPAVVDAAGLGLGLLDELGHDGRGRLPVGDGEGRLDGAERLRGAHRAHLLAHAGEARVDLPVGGAEAVHARLALVELVLGAVELDLVEGGGAVEHLTDARADIVQVREHPGRVHIGLAAEELVAGAGPAIVDAAGLGLGALDELGHDGRGRRPVGHGERRLDGQEGVWALGWRQ